MSTKSAQEYPLANDPLVRQMADRSMRQFRAAEQAGAATEERVKPFMQAVLREERGLLDSETEAEYLAAMGHVLGCRLKNRKPNPLSVPELADKVEGLLDWLCRKDAGRRSSHFMHAINTTLKKYHWVGDRKQIVVQIIGELGQRSAEVRKSGAKRTAPSDTRRQAS